jgi:hypothetical protein
MKKGKQVFHRVNSYMNNSWFKIIFLTVLFRVFFANADTISNYNRCVKTTYSISTLLGIEKRTPVLRVESQFLKSGKEKVRRTYRSRKEKGDLQLDKEIRYTYNKRGFIIREEYYLFGRNLFAVTEYIYSASGLLVSLVQKNTEGGILRRVVYTYDKNNRLHREKNYTIGNKLSFIVFYKYNKEGLLSEELRYLADARMDYKLTFLYNAAGLLLEKKKYNEHERLDTKTVYRYYESGQLKDQSHFLADGSLDTETRYTYGPKGEILERSLFAFNGTLKSQIISQFNEKGDEIVRSVLQAGKGLRKMELIQYFTWEYTYW